MVLVEDAIDHSKSWADAARPLPSRDLMEYGHVMIFDELGALELDLSQPVIYDRPIGLRLLYEDPASGAEHYLIRYPAGLKALPHRHTAAHTIVVLEGRLEANGQTIGPGAYCHFPAGQPMHHAPAAGDSCLFVTIFHGPFDVEPLDHKFAPRHSAVQTATDPFRSAASLRAELPRPLGAERRLGD